MSASAIHAFKEIPTGGGPTPLLSALAKHKHSYGTFLMLPGITTARTVARTGVEWIVVDCEHGNIADDTMHVAVSAITASHISPIVRIAGNEPWMIKRALDSGAQQFWHSGIMIPMIETPEQAASIASASKFPPAGIRGQGSPFPSAAFGQTVPEYFERANSQTLVIPQIETRQGVENVDVIAATPGIDVLFIGPNDLAASLGLLPGSMDPIVLDAIQTILTATKKHDIAAGILAPDGNTAMKWVDTGFTMVGIGGDVKAINGWYANELGRARAS